MPATDDLYAVLGVTASVSAGDLKKAHRKALRTSHPDTGGSSEQFLAVQEAWKTLGDPYRRKAYDRTRGSVSADQFTPRVDGYSPSAGQTRPPRVPGEEPVWEKFGERDRLLYEEQNSWFERARQRQADYLAQPDEPDANDLPASSFRDGMTARGLYLFLALVFALSLSAVMVIGSRNPDTLREVFPLLVGIDVVLVVLGSLVSITVAARFNRKYR
jgi:curved DNA-binding protein CbpA